MDIYVDATTLIALGRLGELDLLCQFGGRPVVLETVLEEVTTQPARTNVECFCSRERVLVRPIHSLPKSGVERGKELLGTDELDGDIHLVSQVLYLIWAGRRVGIVSDDRRVRTVADGLGATVSGTIGVVVRNVADGALGVDDAKALVRRIDSHGLHMTAELREKAYELIEEVAEESNR